VSFAAAEHLVRSEPVAVTVQQAAQLLNVSEEFFDEYVLKHLHPRRLGDVVLISVAELQRWLDPWPAVADLRASVSVTPEQAAQLLNVSRDFLDDQVMPSLRVARVGRKRLIPVRELEQWLERNAARALE
jgi:excisionase family DNA binding protein